VLRASYHEQPSVRARPFEAVALVLSDLWLPQT
jgi:hypothetical protein